MRILVLGASGMLGSMVYRELSFIFGKGVFGTVRDKKSSYFQIDELKKNIINNIHAENLNDISNAIDQSHPEVLINCIGIINKYEDSKDPTRAIPINSLLPHQLSKICKKRKIRLIQPSTDCVFSGKKGGYTEQDASDAKDLYGKTKYLGEIHDQNHVLTLRTSLIGNEINTKNELLEWFLSQESEVKGYTNAIFSGLTTIQFAREIAEILVSHPKIFGLYHISSVPISKYELLKLIAEVFQKDIKIIPDANLKIDRSLDSDLLSNETGYEKVSWKRQITDLENKYRHKK